MPTNVTLKKKDEAGNITKHQHEIEDIDLLQFQEMMAIIKEVIQDLKDDESLREFLNEIFEDELQTGEVEPEEIIKNKDAEFILKAVNAFETLAIKMPEQAFKLLSVLSGIEFSVLQKQKLIDVLDIYDAVVEENDIERLIKRVKKSLGTTAAKAKFLSLARRASAPILQ